MKTAIFLILMMAGAIFAGGTAYETEPNDDWETADVFEPGNEVVGQFDGTEGTWADNYVMVLDEFAVMEFTFIPHKDLAIAPYFTNSESLGGFAFNYGDYGEVYTYKNYFLPDTYYMYIPGSASYAATDETLDYSVETTVWYQPEVDEIEPNNDKESATPISLGEKMTGIYHGEFDMTGQMSDDIYSIQLTPGTYEILLSTSPAVCINGYLEDGEGSHLSPDNGDFEMSRDGNSEKTGTYEITAPGTYYIDVQTEGCGFQTEDESDDFDYLLKPYEITITRAGDLPVDDTVPEATPCESDDDCPDTEECDGGYCSGFMGECGYAADHQWNYYECCNDQDCDEIGVVCRDHECVDAMGGGCVGVCPPGYYMGADCTCVEMTYTDEEEVCGTAFVLAGLLAFAMFVVRK